MNDTQLIQIINDLISKKLANIAGSNGGQNITASGTMTINSVGFVSWDDATVISVLTDQSDQDMIGENGLSEETIPAGAIVTWGKVAKTIAISAGRGRVLKA